MRHVIHNVIASYEIEAQATCAVLSEVQKSLTASGHELGREKAAEPTWAQIVDRQIEETESHLQQQLWEYDRILEGLTEAPRMSASV